MQHTIRRFLRYYIGDIVYGANDGIITTFAVVAAAAGAGVSATVILILGIANLVADGFSMGASKYLSLKSEQSVEKSGSSSRCPVADGAATFASFVIVGALPLIPFLVPKAADNAFTISAFATGASFFFVGAARSLVIKKNAIIAGLEMLIVGGAASAIAYLLGSWVETLVK
jgi:VIT1/CCC1 family predicted Fe2+/Mn2+ transporter